MNAAPTSCEACKGIGRFVESSFTEGWSRTPNVLAGIGNNDLYSSVMHGFDDRSQIGMQVVISAICCSTGFYLKAWATGQPVNINDCCSYLAT